MKKVLITIIIGLAVCLAAYAQAPPDPNSTDPNEIIMPEGTQMPAQIKCPVHGIIGKAFIVIETDDGNKLYCTKCAKNFISRVFELNLPTLEIVK